MAKVTTSAFDIISAQNSKQPVIVMDIEGAPYVITSAKLYTTLRYDDPGVIYDGTYVYDGLRPLDSSKQKNLIDRQGSSSTISQKLEQWDGKASVETLSIKVVDKDQIITQLCTPGLIMDEIMNKKVRILFGYQEISYPNDYLKIFVGYINKIEIGSGYVLFTFTDPSSRRKQDLFNSATTSLSAPVLISDTNLTLTSTTLLYRTILGPDGTLDPGVTIGIRIKSEIITYTNAAINGDNVTLNGVTRGAFGTTADAYNAGETVECFINLNDTPCNLALKTQLSGWNSVWISNVAIRSIVNTDDSSTVPSSVTFNQGVDLIQDYGVTAGDWITISNSLVGNNGSYKIINLINGNRTLIVAGTLIQENPTSPSTAGFRSKYDVYPLDAGLGMTTDDVFVTQFEYVNTTFLTFNFSIPILKSENSGKTWIEENLFKPCGAYSLTQGSRVSMGLTHPPLASDNSKTLNQDNVVKPGSSVVTRGLSDRFFYNEILFNYGYDVINDSYGQSLRYIDADAQNRMSQVSVLEINVKGLPDTPNSKSLLIQRAQRLIQRYKYAAETIQNVFTNFKTGQSVDAGDVVILDDSAGVLQIANTEAGTRQINSRIMEVQERVIDLSQGTTKMTLLSNNGFSSTDRYAVVGPSSFLDPTYAHTTTKIRFESNSYFLYSQPEFKKWENYQGGIVRIHDTVYTNDGSASFTLDPVDPYVMILDPPLGFTPTSSMFVELAAYDNSSDTINTIEKATFASIDSTAPIFSGINNYSFNLQSGYSTRFEAGQIAYVMSPDGSRFSQDVKILNVSGDVITIGPTGSDPSASLGFTPSSGDLLQLAGFRDGGQGYRIF